MAVFGRWRAGSSAAGALRHFPWAGRAVLELVAVREGPFLQLTPTGKGCGVELEQARKQQAAGHMSLASVLVECRVQSEECRMGEDTKWEFKSKGAIEPMLAEFARRVALLRDAGGTLRSIHREIGAVRGQFMELRSAKQRLERILAEGLFAFTKKVDATSFKVRCTILSLAPFAARPSEGISPFEPASGRGAAGR